MEAALEQVIDAGPITNGEVITVIPFGNTLSIMEVTGSELKQAFEISVGNFPRENGGFLHVSGAKVEFDSSKPKGERIVSISYEKEMVLILKYKIMKRIKLPQMLSQQKVETDMRFLQKLTKRAG